MGTTLEGRFRIESQVAEGGFAVLYRGRHLALDRPIAVKVLKALGDLAGDARALFMQRFVLEARTIARLQHPAIVRVLDHGVTRMPSGDEAPWMVLEWIAGEALDQVFARRFGEPYTPAAALALLRPAFEALACAHDERIAHRDVKPENIMLVQANAGGRGPLRLLDFGIAKVMAEGESVGSGATQTRTSVMAFSPTYAAPEQVSNLRTGPWTDVHALGLILTEALAGRQPYAAHDMVELFAEVLTEPRPTPARFGVDVGAWEAIIARAVAIKPDKRFQTAREFLAALDAVPVPTARYSDARTGRPRAAARESNVTLPGPSVPPPPSGVPTQMLVPAATAPGAVSDRAPAAPETSAEWARVASVRVSGPAREPRVRATLRTAALATVLASGALAAGWMWRASFARRVHVVGAASAGSTGAARRHTTSAAVTEPRLPTTTTPTPAPAPEPTAAPAAPASPALSGAPASPATTRAEEAPAQLPATATVVRRPRAPSRTRARTRIRLE